jgi:hypothetical protein
MEDEKTEAPEESEAFKRGKEASERIGKIMEQTAWLQKNAPELHFVFAATPAMGQIKMARGGMDDMVQLGLIDLLKGHIVIPIVYAIEAANKKQNESRIVQPTGAPIPMTHSHR